MRRKCHRLLWIIGCDTQRSADQKSENPRNLARQHVLTKILSDTDTDPNLRGEANPTAPEPKQDKPKKKLSRKRQRPSEETHKAHTEMCGKAVKMMSKIEHILPDKFDSNSKRRGLNMRNIELPMCFCSFVFHLIVFVYENAENKMLFVTQFVFYLMVLFVRAANREKIHGKKKRGNLHI